jgi:hypothetical protein
VEKLLEKAFFLIAPVMLVGSGSLTAANESQQQLQSIPIAQQSAAKEPSAESKAADFDARLFVGTWCGKWDNKYPLCLSFGKSADKNELLTEVEYRWKEYVNAEFLDTVKNITFYSAYRLEIDNITFVLDPNNLNQAKAVGHFTRKERSAELTKQTLQSFNHSKN